MELLIIQNATATIYLGIFVCEFQRYEVVVFKLDGKVEAQEIYVVGEPPKCYIVEEALDSIRRRKYKFPCLHFRAKYLQNGLYSPPELLRYFRRELTTL
jgi:hypothetical protein